MIGVEIDAKTEAEMARKLGCEVVLTSVLPDANNPTKRIQSSLKRARLTYGLGVDVAFEMVGHNLALNNALKMVRRGGSVVMFGFATETSSSRIIIEW